MFHCHTIRGDHYIKNIGWSLFKEYRVIHDHWIQSDSYGPKIILGTTVFQTGTRIFWGPNLFCDPKFLPKRILDPKEFWVQRILGLNWILTMDHSVSNGHGSPCILWQMITLYSLSNDHPVSSYNGTLSIQGCQVSHVSEAFQTKKQENLGNGPKWDCTEMGWLFLKSTWDFFKLQNKWNMKILVPFQSLWVI